MKGRAVFFQGLLKTLKSRRRLFEQNCMTANQQVTDCLEYFIDAEIARTNCRKLPNGNENCVVKNTSKPEKVGDTPTVCGGLGCSEPQAELVVPRSCL